MFKLRNKLNKKGGFTLIEMLIVVAIIAILIAISIPLVSTALERTRMATDAANERAAKAEIMIAYLSGEYEAGEALVPGDVYYYDAVTGTLTDTFGDVDTDTYYGKCQTHSDSILAVSIDINGKVSMEWVDAATDSVSSSTANLCGTKINTK